MVEQTAPAAGTSSKSSKLIHGGLRYLETAQFGLVRESLRERALLLRLAPELVKLRPLHIPVYQDSTRSALTIRAGLSLYSVLAGLHKESLFTQLGCAEWKTLAGLRQDNLKAVFRYYEAQTDDAALTRSVLQSAVVLGADLLMPARFVGAERNGDRERLSRLGLAVVVKVQGTPAMGAYQSSPTAVTDGDLGIIGIDADRNADVLRAPGNRAPKPAPDVVPEAPPLPMPPRARRCDR